MSKDHIENEGLADGHGPVSTGALVRAAADGELTATDQRRLDELLADDPGLGSRIAFEQNLRQATGRVMGAVAAPVGLAERIQSAVASDDLGESLEQLSEQSRQRSFWTRRSLIGSLAAVLVLGISAALIFQATRMNTVPLDANQLVYRQQLAGFLTDQHTQCCEDIKVASSKLTLSDPTAFEELMTSRLGLPVDVPTPVDTELVRFAGGGPCHVPGEGPSGHLLYRANFGPEISVFVKPDNGELPLKPGRTYALNTKECGVPGSRILTLVKDGVVYFIVFDEGPGCQRALELLGISSPTAKF
jgi:hypothetical protein